MLWDVYAVTDNRLKTFCFRRQRYSPDSLLEFRTYDEYLKIFRVLDGHATWKIEDKSYDVRAGDLLILNNTERRQLITDSSDFTIEYIQFLPIFAYPYQRCVMPFFFRPSGFSNKLSEDSEHFCEVSEVFKSLSTECSENRQYKDECIYALFIRLLIGIVRTYDFAYSDDNEKKYCNNKNYEIISEAVRYITTHPYEDLSEDALAKKYYISKFYFSRLFKYYNGMNLSMYVKICRVNYAINLICAEQTDIRDAAFKSGFGCISGFYKAVKDVTGSSPAKIADEYRRKNSI